MLMPFRFSIVFAHNSIDGRNAFIMLDSFLSFLSAKIAGILPPSDAISWGSETVRLPPPGAFIPSLAESGVPPSLDAPPAVLAAAPEKGDAALAQPVS